MQLCAHSVTVSSIVSTLSGSVSTQFSLSFCSSCNTNTTHNDNPADLVMIPLVLSPCNRLPNTHLPVPSAYPSTSLPNTHLPVHSAYPSTSLPNTHLPVHSAYQSTSLPNTHLPVHSAYPSTSRPASSPQNI